MLGVIKMKTSEVYEAFNTTTVIDDVISTMKASSLTYLRFLLFIEDCVKDNICKTTSEKVKGFIMNNKLYFGAEVSIFGRIEAILFIDPDNDDNLKCAYKDKEFVYEKGVIS